MDSTFFRGRCTVRILWHVMSFCSSFGISCPGPCSVLTAGWVHVWAKSGSRRFRLAPVCMSGSRAAPLWVPVFCLLDWCVSVRRVPRGFGSRFRSPPVRAFCVVPVRWCVQVLGQPLVGVFRLIGAVVHVGFGCVHAIEPVRQPRQESIYVNPGDPPSLRTIQ